MFIRVKSIESVTRSNNGQVTMNYTTFSGKPAYAKTFDLKVAKAMYWAKREDKRIGLNFDDNSQVSSVKVA